MPQDNRFL